MPAVAKESTRSQQARDLEITRVFDTPRDTLWEMFVDRDHVIHWWGPKDFTVPELEMDTRVGGRWRAVMQSPQGQDYPQSGVYRKLTRPKELAFTLIWEVEGPGSEMLCIVTFAERAKKTAMTFQKGPFDSPEERESEYDGWNECFDRLDEYLRTGRVTITPYE